MPDHLLFVALWSEIDVAKGQLLHILTREHHLKVELPDIGLNAKAVEEFLPELAQVVPVTSERWLLLLEPSLPHPWQSNRWESLSLGGKLLSSQALVVRKAVWARQAQTSGKPSLLLNLFPATEYPFLWRLQPVFASGTLRTCRTHFVSQQMVQAAELVVLAHGRECGLVDPSGAVFEIPFTYPMPERIWLLACNVSGATERIAVRLMDQGCRTVLCATGDLSAPQMAYLIECCFSKSPTGDGRSSWIARLALALNEIKVPIDIGVWGEVDIDPSASAIWNRFTWDNEHNVHRRPPLDDETSSESFFAAYEAGMSLATWPLTRQWMVPPLLWLAEIHHHPSMRHLSLLAGELNSPEAIRALAAAARRVGNYVQTIKYLSLSLNLPALPMKERAECLGALANIFIDLNLPQSARTAIELHEDCGLSELADVARANYIRLDWISRLEARRGNLSVALDHMTAKRKAASTDTGRELAWQLYIAAWGYLTNQIPQPVSTSYADEAIARLSLVSPDNVGHGNETVAYLLRAIAAHAWTTNYSKSTCLVNKWCEYAANRLSDEDPGPWAYTISFMYLTGTVTSLLFERGIAALERGKYYLESSLFLNIANQEGQSIQILSRFQRRRKFAVDAIELNNEIIANTALAEVTLSTTKEIKYICSKSPLENQVLLPL